MRAVVVFVGYYGGWALTLTLVGRGVTWPGAVIAAGAVALGVWWSDAPWRRFLLFVAAWTAAGALFDFGLATAGLVRYAAAAAPPLPPLWMVGLWALFWATFPIAMGWLYGRTLIGALGGLVFAPLSYLACARLGAFEILAPLPVVVLAAGVWSVCFGVIARHVPRWLPRRRG